MGLYVGRYYELLWHDMVKPFAQVSSLLATRKLVEAPERGVLCHLR